MHTTADEHRTGIYLQFLGDPRHGHAQETHDTKWSEMVCLDTINIK